MIIFTSPGIIAALWMTQLPESPRFLIACGRHGEAKTILEWMNLKNRGAAVDDLKRMSSIDDANETNKPSLVRSLIIQTLPLLQRSNLISLALCSVLHFGTFAISNGVGVFVPEFLKAISLSADSLCASMIKRDELNITTSTCDDSIDQLVFINTSYLGAFYTIAFVMLAVLLKFIDRRHVLTFNLLISVLGGVLMTQVTENWMIVSACFIFVAQSGINISLINSILCETIPPKNLTMAICLAMTFGRLGSVLTSNIIGLFIESECEIIFNIFAGFVFVCFLLSFCKIKSN